MNEFNTELGATTFKNKYASNTFETWRDRTHTIVNDVCGTRNGKDMPIMSKSDRDYLIKVISELKFLPGGRYIYYAGRDASYWNNCYLLRLMEDSREEWSNVTQRAIARPSGRPLRRTGGVASGPLPLLNVINEVGRNVMQGGSRRSAMYGSLNWQHEDALDFLKIKNWHDFNIPGTDQSLANVKRANFNYPAPLDMMNISLNYDDEFLKEIADGRTPDIFMENCKQAMMTGEPGFSFNFGDKQDETLRNACTEITSSDDSDVCNLGSINMGRIENIEEFKDIVSVASKFLVCGTIRAHLPYSKVEEVRQRNRRLGLGLMGVHEWLLKSGYKYEMNNELKSWLKVYRDESEKSANEHCDRFFLSRPKGYRAIAPTGSISILAGTTSGVEPIYAVAYKRRYLQEGTKWKHQFVVDGAAQTIINQGIKPTDIESAIDLAADPERRIKFQYELQKYVDHAISSTLNLPTYGSELNNEDTLGKFSSIVAKYAHGLRGLTLYPEGSRGGQPITACDYEEAHSKRGVIYEDNSDEQCMTGICGI